jgi:3-hydroxy acid dehydrogenase / malonic semialdehyde reductase
MNETRKVFLTGAAGGIGQAIARSLIAESHSVVLADRVDEPLKALAVELGPLAFPLVLDITDAGSVAGLVDAIPAAFGPIDTLINNAGHHVGGGTRFADGPIDDWASIIETNLIGLLRVTHAFLPTMIERNSGHIVNISSINALRIVPTMTPYGASKAGVHMLTDTLRSELADNDIKVTEINPGLTKTNIQVQRFRGDIEKAKCYFDRFRMVLAPEDIARSVMFALNQPPHVQIAQMVVLPTDRF